LACAFVFWSSLPFLGLLGVAKMPRAGPYVPWSSKNCFFLKGLKEICKMDVSLFNGVQDNGTITVMQRETADPSSKLVQKSAKVDDHCVFAGRPHKEEALLI